MKIVVARQDRKIKNKLAIILFIVFNLFIFINVKSQISQGGTPLTFSDSTININEIPTIIVPPVNIDSIIQKDKTFDVIDEEDDEASTQVFHYGVPIALNLDFIQASKLININTGSVYLLAIQSEQAKGLELTFSNFWIPEGAKLFVFNEDKSIVLGAFTHKNVNKEKKFAVSALKGSKIIVEYYEPLLENNDKTSQTKIVISGVIHIFLDFTQNQSTITPTFFLDGFADAASCNVNAMCGSDWCNERRSVVLFAGNGITCSGALITNERRDLRPYILTAAHCYTLLGDPALYIFYFNYQSPVCANQEPAMEYSLSGATLKAGRCESDFALLELYDRPPGDFNVYFAGWDVTSNHPTKGAGIHHPKGDIKKISLYSRDAHKNKENISGISCPVNTWKVGKWDLGTVERGSSGSPLFDGDHLIRGQLSGGSGSTCNRNSFYGRISESWDEGSFSTRRLRDWLSPNSGSSFFISAMSGDEPCKTDWTFNNANDLHTSANVDGLNNPSSIGTRTYDGVYECTNNITATNTTIQSGTSVTFNAGNEIILGDGFVSEGEFYAYAEGCLQGCNTGVGKNGGNDYDDPPFVRYNTDSPKEKEYAENFPDNSTPSFNISSNPFFAYTNFEFFLKEKSTITLTIQNLLGQTLAQPIANQTKEQGEHSLSFDASSLPAGIYFCTFEAKSEKGEVYKEVKKLVKLR